MSGQRCERKRFPGTPDQVRQVRRFIRESVGRDFSLIEDAILIASELATNAITHTMSGQEGSFEVAFLRCHNWILLTVSDQGSVALPIPRRATPEQEANRGLEVMDILALRWGYNRDHSEGGLVWCELGDPNHSRPGASRSAAVVSLTHISDGRDGGRCARQGREGRRALYAAPTATLRRPTWGCEHAHGRAAAIDVWLSPGDAKAPLASMFHVGVGWAGAVAEESPSGLG